MTNFRPMLAAAKFEPQIVQGHLNDVGYLIMQPKIDGMRALIDDSCIPRTRSGKEHKNKHLRSFCMHYPSLRGLDGEVVSGLQYDANSFRESMSGIRAEDGSPEFTFYFFDYFLDPIAQEGYNQRREHLTERLLSTFGHQPNDVISDNIYTCKPIICPQRIVTSLEEIDAYEAELLAAGWEGGILRHPLQPYKFNRSTAREGSLVKLKRFEDDEAIVVGYYPWEHNANEAQTDARGYTTRSVHQENRHALDRLGGFHCHLLRDPSITFDIGVFRGWGHSDRDRLWANRDECIGRILKFKHQGYGGGYDRPRTPVGLGWRDAVEF